MRKYNKHYENGFTTVMINDLCDIEPQLQEIDKDLYIMWNPHTGQHLIMDDVTNTAVMKIPQIGFSQLDARVVHEIKRIARTDYNAFDEVRENEAMKERENEYKTNEIADNLISDTLKYSGRKSVLMGASA